MIKYLNKSDMSAQKKKKGFTIELKIKTLKSCTNIIKQMAPFEIFCYVFSVKSMFLVI